MSLCALIGLNISVIPVIVASVNPNVLNYHYLYCELQLYFRHAFNQMMRTFFILACADRYAISINNLRVRSFSRYQIAFRIIPSVILVWLVLAILLATLTHLQESGRCTSSTTLTSIITSTYLLFSLGIIPLGSMIIFSVLLYINLKKMRGRVQPMTNANMAANQPLRKRDRDMIRMLFIEVLCYTITTTPTAALLIYGSITSGLIKSKERLLIESFITYFIVTFLLYINNSLSFWIYISISRSFRLEFKNLILKSYGFITGRQVRLRDIN